MLNLKEERKEERNVGERKKSSKGRGKSVKERKNKEIKGRGVSKEQEK